MADDLPPGVILPEVDFEIERLTVVILFEGPRRHEYSQDEAQRLANEHVMYTVGLASRGHLLHAGALIDEGKDPTLTGLGFSRLSPAELQPLIEKDPAVVAGMESYRFVTYSFPKGGIDFPRAAARTGQDVAHDN
jgi:hypothetical protein